MNTRKLFYGLLTCIILAAAACTPTSTAEEDNLYEVGIDKKKIRPSDINRTNIDKKKIRPQDIERTSIDKKKIRPQDI